MQGARLFLLGLFAVSLISALFLWQQDDAQNNGKVTLSGAVANALPGNEQTVLVSLKIKNEGPPQRVVSVSSVDADHGMIHGVEPNVEALLPANSSASLGNDGVHFMLMKVKGELEEGRLLTLKVTLDPAGEVVTKARYSSKPVSGHGSHQMAGADDTDEDNKMAGMHKVPADEPQPNLEISVSEDRDTGGWTVNVDTKNFQFAKELADGDHVAGTGHGHIYINGVKLGRVYENVTTIGALPKGSHVVRVTLNTNDHQTYMVAGKRVTATAAITVD